MEFVNVKVGQLNVVGTEWLLLEIFRLAYGHVSAVLITTVEVCTTAF